MYKVNWWAAGYDKNSGKTFPLLSRLYGVKHTEEITLPEEYQTFGAVFVYNKKEDQY